MSTNRIAYIDILKSIAIFFVVWGHLLQYGYDYNEMGITYYDSPVWSFIYSFHMPLFMTISGFFGSSCLKNNFLELIKKKTIQLLVPGLCWVMLGYVGLCIKNHSIQNFKIESLFTTYWFLTTLFLCYIIMWITFSISKKFCNNKFFVSNLTQYNIILPILSCVAVILLWGDWYVSFLLPFFYLGFYIKFNKDKIEKYSWPIIILSLVLFISAYIFWRGDYVFYESTNVIFKYSDGVQIDLYHLKNMFLRLILGASLSLFLLLIVEKITNFFPTSRFHLLSNIGLETLGIYLIHYFFIRRIHLSSVSYCLFVVESLLITLVVIVLCYLVIQIINRNKYTKLLIGKYK